MRTVLRLGAALLGAGLLAACTIDERFTFSDPVEAVALEELNAVPAPRGVTCAPGSTVYWGKARNTGDVFLYDVQVFLDVIGPAGDLLGRFSGSVYNGESGTDDFGNTNPDSTLDIDQQGSFTVCTTVPWGAAARAEASFRYVVFEPEE